MCGHNDPMFWKTCSYQIGNKLGCITSEVWSGRTSWCAMRGWRGCYASADGVRRRLRQINSRGRAVQQYLTIFLNFTFNNFHFLFRPLRLSKIIFRIFHIFYSNLTKKTLIPFQIIGKLVFKLSQIVKQVSTKLRFTLSTHLRQSCSLGYWGSEFFLEVTPLQCTTTFFLKNCLSTGKIKYI